MVTGLRLLITGPTRSGKSTSVHAFLSDALRRPWRKIILLDGKGVELLHYKNARTTNGVSINYFGPNELDNWATVLANVTTGLESRFQALTSKGLRAAAPDDPSILILADEVQIGTRDKENGRSIKQSLTQIAEQSAALGDVLVLTCQREQNSVPPAIRLNCDAKLRMFGAGFFLFQPDGLPSASGRLTYTTPQNALNLLNAPLNGTANLRVEKENLLEILGVDKHDDGPEARANATLYLGKPGSGRTYHLHTHQATKAQRTIYVDLNESHKTWLIAIIEQGGASAPPRSTITQLATMAALALKAEPTLLCLDNIDKATEKARPSIHKMLQAAYRVAMSAEPPKTESQERKVNPFIPRCDVIRIAPLTPEEAAALADEHLPPNLDRRKAIKRRILQMGQGHPATIVALCRQAEKGTLSELRKMETAVKNVSILWVILVILMASFIVLRYQYDSYVATFALIAATVVFRPLFYRSIRGKG